MDREQLHRQLRTLLRTFRPADAAFVLHLAQCERCRGVAERLLAPEEEPPVNGYLGALSPVERGIVFDLTRAGFLLSLVDQTPPDDDLPPAALRDFLELLQPQQSAFIRHILICHSCRERTARTLAPRRAPSDSVNPLSLLDATA